MKTMTHKEWVEEGKKRFGPDVIKWKFKCVSCGEIQTLQDFLDTGMPRSEAETYLGFSCIGRFCKTTPPPEGCCNQIPVKGCDWTLGGLFRVHKLEIEMEDGRKIPVFEFADEEANVPADN